MRKLLSFEQCSSQSIQHNTLHTTIAVSHNLNSSMENPSYEKESTSVEQKSSHTLRLRFALGFRIAVARRSIFLSTLPEREDRRRQG